MRFFLRPDGRTYSILSAAPDLLGDIVVVTIHGSQRSRMGGIKTYVAEDFMAAEKMIARIAATRIKHGYQEQL
jgi:hypothetical protein